jgi:hypothetical protein
VKLKEGKTTLRLLIAPKDTVAAGGTGKFWKELGVHWIKTEKDGKPVAVVGCHDEVYGKPCATCTAIDRASKAVTSDEELAIIKEWKTKKTAVVVALVKSGADKSPEPQIVELTGGAFADICSTWETYLADDVDILDPDTGVDLVIERSGRGFDTKYRVQVAPKSDKVDRDILTRMPDLLAHIEKEFFRGDEPKAMLAISNMTGINTDGLKTAALAHRPAGLLTSSVVEDAEIAEIVEEEVAESDDEKEERELAEKIAARRVVKAAKDAAEALAKAAAEVAARAKAATVETDDEKEERELNEKMAALAAKKKAAAATKTAAAKAAAVDSTVSKDDGFGAALPQDEIDEMLAGLDE